MIQICHHDSQGLANDAQVLSDHLSDHIRHKHGPVSIVHYPEQVLYTAQTIPHETDCRIFLEHASMSMMNTKSKNVWIPNLEMINSMDVQCAQHMDLIVAKTPYAYDVLRNRFPDKKVVYWGWTSIDRGLAVSLPTKDYNAFLHVKGVSRFKNTQLVLETWLRHPEWPTLTVVHHGNPGQNGYVDIPVRDAFAITHNVRMIQRKVSDTELTDLMNRHGVHVCPSVMEGFGHYINEALSARAVVVTTDGHPMKQFVENKNGFLIRPVQETPQSLGTRYTLDTQGFEEAIQKVLETPIETRAVMGDRSRDLFDRIQLKPII